MLYLWYWGKWKDVEVIQAVALKKTIDTQRTGEGSWLKSSVNFITVFREMVQA